jgi:hypothetical protein
MPKRYFIAMCLISILLAGVFVYDLPTDVVTESPGDVQAVPPPQTATQQVPPPPSANKTPQTPLTTPVETVIGPPLPTDRGGQAVLRLVSPEYFVRPPLTLPEDAKTWSPQLRVTAERIAEPQPAVKGPELVKVPVAALAKMKISPPGEIGPLAVTAWAEADAPKPTLPSGPVVKAKAPDPAKPPAAPVLAKPPANKAPTDDPTIEAGNEALVNQPAMVSLVASAFVRVALPDPFAFAEQVRAKLEPAQEPGLTPVPVNPMRPK